MQIEDIVLTIFCFVDDKIKENGLSNRPNSKLSLGEIITIGVLFGLKGSSKRQFFRWLEQNQRHNFPSIPERTRLFRLLKIYDYLTRSFLSEKSTMGIIDSFGIELIHPIREGRTRGQMGKKGYSNKRWIVGMKLIALINQFGMVVDWKTDTANVHDKHYREFIKNSEMIVLADSGFHGKGGDPENLKICKRGQWSERFLIERLFSILTRFMNLKKVSSRVREYFDSHIAYALCAFNIVSTLFGSFSSLSL